MPSRTVATWFAPLLVLLLGALVSQAAPASAAPDTCGLAAHRGEHSVSTENSVGAIRSAVSAGADYVEVDVRVSADGMLFLMHDRRVDRTTDGTGRIDRKSRAEVRALQLDDGSRVPTLSRALDVAGESGIEVIVELKAMGGRRTYRALVAEVAALGVERVRVTSFSQERLLTLGSMAPRIDQGIISRTRLSPEEVAPYDAILLEHNAMDADWLAAMPSPVFVWTPGPVEWDSWATQVRAVITDDTLRFAEFRQAACTAPSDE